MDHLMHTKHAKTEYFKWHQFPPQ